MLPSMHCSMEVFRYDFQILSLPRVTSKKRFCHLVSTEVKAIRKMMVVTVTAMTTQKLKRCKTSCKVSCRASPELLSDTNRNCLEWILIQNPMCFVITTKIKRHWTLLVIVKDHSSHFVYLNICIK